MNPKAKPILLTLVLGLWAVIGLLNVLGSQVRAAAAIPDPGQARRASGTQVVSNTLPKGLIHYWRFDEGSGTVAVDSVSGNHGAVLGGAAWIQGPSGKALYFDGVDDEVAIPQTYPSILPLHQTGDFSLLFWIKRVDTVHRTIFWTRDDTTDANRFHINTMWDGSGNLGADYRAPDGTIHGVAEGEPIHLPANQWTHIAIVRSGNTYFIYQDGQLVQQNVDSSPDLPTYAGAWHIARAATNSPDHAYFLGGLDEIAIFNAALTAEEVQTYYQRSASGLGYAITEDFDDNSLNPSLWQAQTTGSGPTISETNQRLEITLPTNAQETGDGVFSAGVNSVCKVKGDFDMQVNYELLTWPTNNGVRLGLSLFAPGTSYKTVERVSRAGSETPSGEYYSANFGSSTPLTATTHTSGTLRMTRSGDTLSAYYQDTNDQWVQILSESGHTTGSLYFGLAAWSHDTYFADQEVKIAFDDLTLYWGRLLCVQMSSGYNATASPAGSPFTYIHTLTNTGSFTDTFAITHTSTQNWPTSYSTPITLGAGKSTTFTVTITPPVGVISGTVETTVITVTSQTDADISAALTDGTTLRVWYRYIPVVMRGQ